MYRHWYKPASFNVINYHFGPFGVLIKQATELNNFLKFFENSKKKLFLIKCQETKRWPSLSIT